ncbi:NUDIX domain-containing protein, partial [Pseudomonas chengduensis]
LPGGGLEPGESPAQAVTREVMEESGQRVRLTRIIDLQSDPEISAALLNITGNFSTAKSPGLKGRDAV